MQQIGAERVLDKTWLGGKVIQLELCKKFKFDHTNKWYMHNAESVPENGTHTHLRDFDRQTDHVISGRRSDLYNNQQ